MKHVISIIVPITITFSLLCFGSEDSPPKIPPDVADRVATLEEKGDFDGIIDLWEQQHHAVWEKYRSTLTFDEAEVFWRPFLALPREKRIPALLHAMQVNKYPVSEVAYRLLREMRDPMILLNIE